MIMRVVILTLSVLVMLTASPALAEMYGGVYGGVVLPNDLTNVEGTGLASGLSVDDLGMNSGGIIGGKFGYYFERWKWLGAEAELSYFHVGVEQQTVPATLFGVPGTVSLTGADVGTLMGNLNVLVRYPHKRYQPYAGVGLAIVNARISSSAPGFVDDSSTAPGLSVLAGVRGLVTDHIVLFGEYKYIRASLSFDDVLGPPNGTGLDVDFSTNMFVGGVAYQF